VLFGKGQLFLDIDQLFDDAKKQAHESEDVKRFLNYFHKSSIVKYHMLAAFEMFYQGNKDIVNLQSRGGASLD